jgi:hypothetical protein
MVSSKSAVAKGRASEPASAPNSTAETALPVASAISAMSKAMKRLDATFAAS